MKLAINGVVKINITVLMNRAGYHHHLDRRSRQSSYVRRLGNLLYPRFHLYINQETKQIILKLHLDEKKPSYQGSNRHSGQYDSDLVKEELKRVAIIISQQV